MTICEAPPDLAGRDVSSRTHLESEMPCECADTRKVFSALAHLRERGLRLYAPTVCQETGAFVIRGYAPTYYVRQLVAHGLKQAKIRFVDRIEVTRLLA